MNIGREFPNPLENIVKTDNVTSLKNSCGKLWKVCAVTRDEIVGHVFGKLWYVLGVNSPVLELHDRDSSYIKHERRYGKWMQHVFEVM